MEGDKRPPSTHYVSLRETEEGKHKSRFEKLEKHRQNLHMPGWRGQV